MTDVNEQTPDTEALDPAPQADGGDGITPWAFPEMGPDGEMVSTPLAADAAPELEDKVIPEEARREGFDLGFTEGKQAGYEKGLEEAKTEMAAALASATQEQTHILTQLIEHMQQPADRITAEVETSIVQMIQILVERICLHECTQNEAHLSALVKKALGLLPLHEMEATISLHPEDIALVQSALNLPDTTTLTADDTLMRGDVRVQTSSALIDASLRNRIAELLGTKGDANVDG